MTNEQWKKHYQKEIKKMKAELKDPYISYEREQELKDNIETLEDELKRL